MNYDAQLRNLTNAISSLPQKDIKFLFFLANDMSVPKVRTRFKRFKIDKTTWYIVNGFSTNCCYIYKESVLKYITSPLKPSKPPDIHQARILQARRDGDTNHGDHITYCINRLRSMPHSLVLSHFTEYIDDGKFNFTKVQRDYNFLLNPSYFTSYTKFLSDTPFTTKSGDLPGLRIDQVYDDQTTCKVIHTLCDVVLNATPLRGGAKRKPRTQRGGTNTLYKKVLFDTNEFIEFITKTLFQRVADINDNLETIQVMYDENNDLNERGNENILIVYDFIDMYRNMFYIPAKVAMMACFAEREIKKNNVRIVEQEELACHKQYFEMVKGIEQNMQRTTIQIA